MQNDSFFAYFITFFAFFTKNRAVLYRVAERREVRLRATERGQKQRRSEEDDGKGKHAGECEKKGGKKKNGAEAEKPGVKAAEIRLSGGKW